MPCSPTPRPMPARTCGTVRVSSISSTSSDGRVTGAVIEDRERAVHSVAADVGDRCGRTQVDGRQDGRRRRVPEGRHAAAAAYAFWSGLENRGNRWYYRPGVSVGAIPTNHGNTCVFVAIPPGRFRDELQGDMDAGYHRALRECSAALADEVSQGVCAERVRGFPGHLGHMRQSHGPGWALVGDAGYFKDPITAHGISDALRDAEYLARAVEQGTERAMAAYQSTRDELSAALFESSDAIAGFEWNLDSLQTLHKDLSRAMNHEVEALVSLDPQTEPTLETSPTPHHKGDAS
jgi:2-polyprenyl-6-methoxyphenol hydroxylase-like FAD-dependent oxidoreductase